MAQLVCKNLKLGYESKVVVDDLSFSVNEGDYLCIVGENGSGKSTLIKTILHHQRPLGGFAKFEGLSENDVGYLPQQTIVQRDFPASVKEVVLSGCLNHIGFRPFYNKSEKKIAESNMQRLGIEKLKNTCYRDLSGGQQQRVLLARALCATTKILFLDEPVTGLDPNAVMELYEIIQQLNDEGITIVMISHDIVTSIKYCSHVLHIGGIGDKNFFGTKQEYLSSDFSKLFLTEKK